MALQNIVDANIVVAPAAVEPEPLDITIVGLTLTAPQVALWGPNLVRQVNQTDYLDVLAEVGITDGEAAYEFLQVMFGQDASPRTVYLGQRDTPVAQQTDFLLDGGAGAAPDGLYRITLNGVNFDENSVGQTRAQVATALQGLINADPLYSAAIGGTPETIDVTAAEAGAGFSFAASAPVGESWTITPTTANVGLSTDLAAWDTDVASQGIENWYLVTAPEAVSEGVADNVASTVQGYTRDITAHLRSDSATDPNAATGSGYATTLAPKGYDRTVIVHVPTATDYGHAGPIGLKMPTTPGSDTWANKTIRVTSGTSWTVTQRSNLEAGPYALLDQITSIPAVWSGNYRALSGIPFDVVRGADLLKASIIAAVLTKLNQTPAPSYTPAGFGEIGGAISAVLVQFVSTGFLAATRPDGSPGFTVTIPAVPPPDDALRVARRTPPFEFTALINGSIEIVDQIDGVLIQ